MIKALLNGILSACNQLITLICLPIDLAIKGAFPDLSSTIEQGVNGINSLLSNIVYGIGYLPTSFVKILVLIFGFHLSLIALNKSVNAVVRIYKIIQKVKFW